MNCSMFTMFRSTEGSQPAWRNVPSPCGAATNSASASAFAEQAARAGWPAAGTTSGSICCVRRRGHEAARPRQGLRVFQDEGRIHQHLAIVADERRRLDHGIDLLEPGKRTEDRKRLVLEAQAEKLQRDRDAAHVRRIEHADKLHGV